MPILKRSPKNLEDLKSCVLESSKVLALSSQTSTVISYSTIESFIGEDEISLIDLSSLPKIIELSHNRLRVSASVNWKEARAYLRSKNRDLKTYPTEELACICAGAATSATGERSFGFGPFRDQIHSLQYLDVQGEVHELFRDKQFSEAEGLVDYQKDYEAFKEFKNAPYPRLENETDLMIGMEGQLGIITELTFDTTEFIPLNYFIIPLERWERREDSLLEVFKKVQSFRKEIISCEFLDWNSLKNFNNSPFKNKDIIALEIRTSELDSVVKNFLSELSFLNLDDVLELSEGAYHDLRKGVPRSVSEYISQKGLIKKGTDVQVKDEYFKRLIEKYKKASELGEDYVLFGHLGDGHLHFNFLPQKGNTLKCDQFLKLFYEEISQWNCSPFAEHGIGIIKQEHILSFLGDNQFRIFKRLKECYDLNNKFFPYGFLQLGFKNAQSKSL